MEQNKKIVSTVSLGFHHDMQTVVNLVANMRVRDSRKFFAALHHNDPNLVLPQYGISVGEFCVGHIITKRAGL
jgi:hypothetical protein